MKSSRVYRHRVYYAEERKEINKYLLSVHTYVEYLHTYSLPLASIAA